MNRGSSSANTESEMDVMMFPSDNKSNHYIESLSHELEDRDINIVDYPQSTVLPLLWPIICRGRPDVIHIHWFHRFFIGATWPRTLIKIPRLFVELIIIRALGISLVWTVHNLYSHDRQHPRLEKFLRSAFANGFFDTLIVHCDTARTEVREEYRLGQATRTVVIPHGHYIDQYPDSPSRDTARDSLSITDDTFVFAFFGQIREYKQVPSLVQTFIDLDAEHCSLLVAGNPASDTIERQIVDAAAGRDDIITVLDFIADENVPTYFAAADAVVLPYRDILTSGSALLAMSLSRPVIVPRIGCLPQLIDQDREGILYDPTEPTGLRRAMERMLHSDTTEMGNRGFDRAATFDWGSIADQTRRVYEE